jgi:hypothetical protein
MASIIIPKKGQVIKTVVGYYIFGKVSNGVWLCFDYDMRHHVYTSDPADLIEIKKEVIKNVGTLL